MHEVSIKHFDILEQGVEVWNRWRTANPDITPDLSLINLDGKSFEDANFDKTTFMGTKLRGTTLKECTFRRSYFLEAKLGGAILPGSVFSQSHIHDSDFKAARLNNTSFNEALINGCDFSDAKLHFAQFVFASIFKGGTGRQDDPETDFSNAILTEANFSFAHLNNVNFSGAELQKANLFGCSLIDCNLNGANLEGSWVYGVAAWDLNLDNTNQSGLIISKKDEPTITVDSIEVANFLHLLLNNQKIRDAIDTITSKVVLILGRFATERKAILAAIRVELKNKNYIPVMFDFEQPTTRSITETVTTLARMSRFVIADVTEARSVSAELEAIVPSTPSVPVQPIIMGDEEVYGLFRGLTRYHWFLDVHRYSSVEDLLSSLSENIIAPAESKVEEIRTCSDT